MNVFSDEFDVWMKTRLVSEKNTLLFLVCFQDICYLNFWRKKALLYVRWFWESAWKVLWFKLLSYDLNGKMYDIINNMYSQIKSRIVYNLEFSNFFNCENGVRQGENISAFLFSIYRNDLHDFFLISEMFENCECVT